MTVGMTKEEGAVVTPLLSYADAVVRAAYDGTFGTFVIVAATSRQCNLTTGKFNFDSSSLALHSSWQRCNSNLTQSELIRSPLDMATL